MIGAIIDLIKTGFSFFQNKKETQVSSEVVHTQETNETAREETKRSWSGRNFMYYVVGSILLWNYVVCPVLDCFGIVVFQLPLGEIFKIIALLLTGS